MSASEEGTKHSDYLFKRDKQLKDGYDKSQKNYRILPEISKDKHKLTDKEQIPYMDVKVNHESKQKMNDKKVSAKNSTQMQFDDVKVFVEDMRPSGEFQIFLEQNNVKKKVYPNVEKQSIDESYVSSPNQSSRSVFGNFLTVLFAIIVIIISINLGRKYFSLKNEN